MTDTGPCGQPGDGPPPDGQRPWEPPGGQPASWPPPSGQPGYEQPAYGRPGPWGPPDGRPGYRPPPDGRPGPGQPPVSWRPPGPWQPPYGEPGYGQPPAEPHHGPEAGGPHTATPIRRRARRGVALVALAVVLVGLALVSTVHRSPTLRPGAVQQAVAAQFQDAYGVRVDLSCPDDMAVRRGASYVCTGRTAGGERVQVRITVVRVTGARYEWQLG